MKSSLGLIPIVRYAVLCVFALVGNLACLSGTAIVRGEGIPFHGETVVKFATKDDAREAFLRRDRFTRSLSKFDLQSRMDQKEVDLASFLEFSADQFAPWTAEDRARLTPVVESLAKRLAALNLPLPKTILLIHTTGKVEGNAAYCRGPAIMIPPKYLKASSDRMEALLAHELFHVLSSHNPALRYRLYEIIGFQSCPPVRLPPNLSSRKITNPDAPELDCVLRIDVDGETVPCTPILFSEDAFEVGGGKTFFEYLKFQLLVLEPEGDSFRPRLRDGKPWFVVPQRPDLYWNIGLNTGYILHPEEVLADNFRDLIFQRPNLPTPRVVQQMLSVLQAE